MSMTRRDRVQTITRDWGVCPVDGWQATVKEELRALYEREELLEKRLKLAEDALGEIRDEVPIVPHSGGVHGMTPTVTIHNIVERWWRAQYALKKENPR